MLVPCGLQVARRRPLFSDAGHRRALPRRHGGSDLSQMLPPLPRGEGPTVPVCRAAPSDSGWTRSKRVSPAILPRTHKQTYLKSWARHPRHLEWLRHLPWLDAPEAFHDDPRQKPSLAAPLGTFAGPRALSAEIAAGLALQNEIRTIPPSKHISPARPQRLAHTPLARTAVSRMTFGRVLSQDSLQVFYETREIAFLIPDRLPLPPPSPSGGRNTGNGAELPTGGPSAPRSQASTRGVQHLR